MRRDERRGTLVAVRDRPGLAVNRSCSSFFTDDIDVQGVAISDESMAGDLNIFNVYVSKASTEQDWDFLHQTQSSGNRCSVAGDFNARSLVWCHSGAHNSSGRSLQAALNAIDMDLVNLLQPTRLLTSNVCHPR